MKFTVKTLFTMEENDVFKAGVLDEYGEYLIDIHGKREEIITTFRGIIARDKRIDPISSAIAELLACSMKNNADITGLFFFNAGGVIVYPYTPSERFWYRYPRVLFSDSDIYPDLDTENVVQLSPEIYWSTGHGGMLQVVYDRKLLLNEHYQQNSRSKLLAEKINLLLAKARDEQAAEKPVIKREYLSDTVAAVLKQVKNNDPGITGKIPETTRGVAVTIMSLLNLETGQLDMEKTIRMARNEKSDHEREIAIAAMSFCEGKDVTGLLTALMTDQNNSNRIRITAARSLAQHVESVEGVSEVLFDEICGNHYLLRTAIAESLIDYYEDFDFVSNALRGHNGDVFNSSRVLFRKMKDRPGEETFEILAEWARDSQLACSLLVNQYGEKGAEVLVEILKKDSDDSDSDYTAHGYLNALYYLGFYPSDKVTAALVEEVAGNTYQEWASHDKEFDYPEGDTAYAVYQTAVRSLGKMANFEAVKTLCRQIELMDYFTKKWPGKVYRDKKLVINTLLTMLEKIDVVEKIVDLYYQGEYLGGGASILGILLELPFEPGKLDKVVYKLLYLVYENWYDNVFPAKALLTKNGTPTRDHLNDYLKDAAVDGTHGYL